MNKELEKVVDEIDVSDDQRKLLRETITNATEDQQTLWYVILRGMDIEYVRDFCEVFALKNKALREEVSIAQMVNMQEEILLNAAKKEDLRNKLKE